MDADGVGLVDLEAADSLEELGQRDAGFHSGQMGAQAEVGAAAETQEIGTDLTADHKIIGIVEHPLVAVRGPRQQEHHIAIVSYRFSSPETTRAKS